MKYLDFALPTTTPVIFYFLFPTLNVKYLDFALPATIQEYLHLTRVCVGSWGWAEHINLNMSHMHACTPVISYFMLPTFGVKYLDFALPTTTEKYQHYTKVRIGSWVWAEHVNPNTSCPTLTVIFYLPFPTLGVKYHDIALPTTTQEYHCLTRLRVGSWGWADHINPNISC